MRITQLRNATIVIHSGDHRILVDPMLAPAGTLPALRLFDGKRQRNPTVALPAQADAVLAQVTHCLITHCQKGHFDHLDRAGARWLRERRVPVICSAHDGAYLAKRGLVVQPLRSDAQSQWQPFLGGRIRTVPCRHGRGLISAAMEHGVGFFIELPGEPSLYLSGDTVLTDAIATFVRERQPQVCVVPAGGARFDLGGEIIMGIDEVLALTRLARGTVLANHLEAISHCPVSRAGLRTAAAGAGLAQRLRALDDGDSAVFAREPVAQV